MSGSGCCGCVGSARIVSGCSVQLFKVLREPIGWCAFNNPSGGSRVYSIITASSWTGGGSRMTCPSSYDVVLMIPDG